MQTLSKRFLLHRRVYMFAWVFIVPVTARGTVMDCWEASYVLLNVRMASPDQACCLQGSHCASSDNSDNESEKQWSGDPGSASDTGQV